MTAPSPLLEFPAQPSDLDSRSLPAFDLRAGLVSAPSDHFSSAPQQGHRNSSLSPVLQLSDHWIVDNPFYCSAQIISGSPLATRRAPQRPLRLHDPASRPETQDTIALDRATMSTNPPHTPITSDHFASLCNEVAKDTQSLDSVCKRRLQTLSRAVEKVFAGRALLLEENRILSEQNNEKDCRQSNGQKVVGHAKVMSYDDIVEAQKKRDLKVSKKDPHAEEIKSWEPAFKIGGEAQG